MIHSIINNATTIAGQKLMASSINIFIDEIILIRKSFRQSKNTSVEIFQKIKPKKYKLLFIHYHYYFNVKTVSRGYAIVTNKIIKKLATKITLIIICSSNFPNI